MALFGTLDLLEGPLAARDFGVQFDALVVGYLALAVCGGQVAVGPRDLRWLRSQDWSEADAGIWMSQLLVGLSATAFPALCAFFPASNMAAVVVVASLAPAARVVSARRGESGARTTVRASG